MVRIKKAGVARALLTLAASICLATVFALFSGVSYDPEAAAEHKRLAHKTFASQGTLSQQELDETTTPISEINAEYPTYNFWNDLVAGFRQSGLWLLFTHTIFLLIVRPRIAETIIVSVTIVCLIVLIWSVPNPALEIVLSTSVYSLVEWLRSGGKRLGKLP